MPLVVKQDEFANPVDIRFGRPATVIADTDRITNPIEKFWRLTHPPRLPRTGRVCKRVVGPLFDRIRPLSKNTAVYSDREACLSTNWRERICEGVNTTEEGVNTKDEGAHTYDEGVNTKGEGVNTKDEGVNANEEGVTTIK